MDHDQKIDLINAYRHLLDANLPQKRLPANVYEQIQAEYREWVKGKIDALLGLPQTPASLSPQEVLAIRAFLAPTSTSSTAGPLVRTTTTTARAPVGPRPLPATRQKPTERPVGDKNEYADDLERMEDDFERKEEAKRRAERGQE